MLVSRVLLGGAYSADDRPTVRSLGKPALGPRLIRPGAVIAVLLLYQVVEIDLSILMMILMQTDMLKILKEYTLYFLDNTLVLATLLTYVALTLALNLIAFANLM